MSGPPLSIVVAVTGESDVPRSDTAAAPAWLAALLREAARSPGAELFVVGDVARHAPCYHARAGDAGVVLRVLWAPRTALVPELWGIGLHAARGGVVAFSIDQCIVAEGWGESALAGIAAGDAGVGGPIALAPDASRTARAIYYLRYSAFLPLIGGEVQRPGEIAGDNAAYARSILLRYPRAFDHGFWEVEAHHLMRADGATLSLLAGMTATFGGSPSLGSFIGQRFAHGAHFGAWRVAAGGRSPWTIVVGAPLVPVVLLLRKAATIKRTPGGLGKLVGAIVPFMMLAAAWASGEAAGALRGRPPSGTRER